MDLVFQLERGGTDAFRRLPVVWRVDEHFEPIRLRQCFMEGWMDWFGPALRRHAEVIGEQLVDVAACGQVQDEESHALSRWWAMPVVRRRRRRMRITLSPPVAGHAPGWPLSGSSSRFAEPLGQAAGAHLEAMAVRHPNPRADLGADPGAEPDGRHSAALGWRLNLRMLQFWGAASDQAFQPGPGVWRDCRERAAMPALQLPGLHLDRALGDVAAGPPCVEHLLHDGIGLLVLVPSLSAASQAELPRTQAGW